MTEVGSAWVSVLPEAKGFGKKLQGDIGPQVDDSGKKSGGVFGGAFKLAAAAAAGIGALSFVKDSIAEARESQKVAAQTANVIKTTGGVAKVTAGDVDKLATAISNKTGIDDEAIASASNLLLTFTGVRNEVGKGNDIFNQATKIATDMGAALGTDASGSAIQLGKALNDPIKGISALSRVGVSFTAQQKEQIKSLVAHNDTLGAQKIILGELSKEFGGSAAAQATAGEKAAVAFGNLKEAVGTALLPVLDKLMGFLSGAVIPGLYSLAGFLTSALAPVFYAVKGAVTDFVQGVQGIGPATDGVFTVLRQIGLGVRAFFDALRYGDVTSDGFVGKMEMIGDFLYRTLPPAFAAVKAVITDTLLPALQTAAGFFVGTVLPALQQVGAYLGSALLGAFNSIRSAIADNLPEIRAFATGILTIAQHIATIVLPVVVALVGTGIRVLGEAIGVTIRVIVNLKDVLIPLTAAFVAYKIVVLAQAAAMAVATAATKVMAAGQWLLNAALTANPIGLVIAAIALLVAGFVLAYKKSETFRDIVNGLWDMFKKYTVLGVVISNFDKIRDSIGWVIDKVKDLISWLGKIKMPKIDIPGGGVLAKIPGFASGVTNFGGGLALVGERGPETVVLPRGSDVLPAGQTADLLAGTPMRQDRRDLDYLAVQIARQLNGLVA